MGGTMYSFKNTITVRDIDHLPEGKDPDIICDEVGEIIHNALMDWYENKGGKELLKCEPV